jgi:hypothetical protein
MAGYLAAISLAKRIGADGVVSLLQQSLAEEEGKATDRTPETARSSFLLKLRRHAIRPAMIADPSLQAGACRQIDALAKPDRYVRARRNRPTDRPVENASRAENHQNRRPTTRPRG